MSIKSRKFKGLEKDGGNEISKFEDLLDIVGTNGWKNASIFILTSLCGIVLALHTLSYQFLGATPDHWCHNEHLSRANWTDEQIKEISIPHTIDHFGAKEFSKCEMKDLNYEEISSRNYEDVFADKNIRFANDTKSCNFMKYDEKLETIVTQWDLVCDRRALYSTTQSAVMIGFLIGSFLGGYLIDKYGRTFIYKSMTLLYIVFGYFTVMSPSIHIFICMRIISSMLNFGIYLSGFVLTMEISSTKQRSLVSNFFMIPWAIGIMLTPGIAYLVRPWKQLQIALVSPALILLISFFLLPESPRWLIINERYDEALTILTSIARANKRTLPSDEKMFNHMKFIHDVNTSVKNEEKQSYGTVLKHGFLHIFSMVINRKYTLITLVIFFCWFAAAMVYYGVSLNSDVVNVNDYLYIFLGGIIEIMSYIILWPVTAYFGRKKSTITFFFITALSILSVMTLVLLTGKNSFPTVKLVLFLTGKFAITCAFHVLWVCTGELYPTKVRSLILGESSMLARIGSGSSPYINDILGSVTIWAPSALFGGVSLVAGILAFIIPETAKKDLPDSLENLTNDVESEAKK